MRRLHQQLYNAALEERIQAYRKQGRSLSFSQQCKSLTQLRAELPEYDTLNAQSSQVTLKRVEDTYAGFFRRLKDPNCKNAGFPRFKSIRRYSGWGSGSCWRTCEPYSWRQQRYKKHGDGWRLFANEKHGYLRLSGVGMLKLRGKARTLGTPKTMEILYKQGKWYASVVMDCEPVRESGTRAIGIDWGVETFATLAQDDGSFEAISNERHLQSHLPALARLQRDLARKKRGSRNWRKLKQQLAAQHARIARQRQEFLHQTTARIVKNHALIAVEKLNVKAMTAAGGSHKAGLNREILSTSPGKFHVLLKTKAEEAGLHWVEIAPRKVKPSQTCSGCGHQEKKPLSQRWHHCQHCGLSLSRDENAARVILNWALTKTATGREPAPCGAESSAMKHETPGIAIACRE